MENKVQCISGGYIGLTEGDTYNAYQTDSMVDMVLVENDVGEMAWYDFKAFNFFPLPEINLPPNTPLEFQEILDNFSGSAKGFLVPDVRVEYVEREKEKITYKDFLASMPKSSDACVTMYGDNSSTVYVYGLEFDCPTEERAEEVYAALITLFKEP